MKDAVEDRFNRLKRSAQIIASLLDNPNQTFIRKAENSGCLDEFDFLLEEVRLWLDDDFYFEDVAWNMVNKPDSLKQAS
jgi:hypothetical protein